MNFIRKIPIPIAGLILAIVSLGNFLLSKQFEVVGTILVWTAIVLISLLTIRVFTDFPNIRKDMNNPIIASVSPTFTMSTFGIASYLQQFDFLIPLSTVLWYGAILLHILFMVYFTFHFVIKRDLTIHNVYPSWFIMYIGIGVITFTSPTFNIGLGKLFFVLALINYVILVPIVLFRIFRTQYNEEPTLPLLTILAAPTSLCLAGYVSIASEPSYLFVIPVLIFSQTLYFIALYFLPNIWRLRFYPSFAAFTFPLVITTIAASLANSVLNNQFLSIVVIVEATIASVVTLTVFIRYLHFIISSGLKERKNMVTHTEQHD